MSRINVSTSTMLRHHSAEAIAASLWNVRQKAVARIDLGGRQRRIS
jgi:hypothetical protein